MGTRYYELVVYVLPVFHEKEQGCVIDYTQNNLLICMLCYKSTIKYTYTIQYNV